MSIAVMHLQMHKLKILQSIISIIITLADFAI